MAVRTWRRQRFAAHLLADDTNRPQLAEALKACRAYGATPIIAKLDRVSRDAHFLLALQKADPKPQSWPSAAPSGAGQRADMPWRLRPGRVRCRSSASDHVDLMFLHGHHVEASPGSRVRFRDQH